MKRVLLLGATGMLADRLGLTRFAMTSLHSFPTRSGLAEGVLDFV